MPMLDGSAALLNLAVRVATRHQRLRASRVRQPLDRKRRRVAQLRSPLHRGRAPVVLVAVHEQVLQRPLPAEPRLRHDLLEHLRTTFAARVSKTHIETTNHNIKANFKEQRETPDALRLHLQSTKERRKTPAEPETITGNAGMVFTAGGTHRGTSIWVLRVTECLTACS